jgi:hypothetical protein
MHSVPLRFAALPLADITVTVHTTPHAVTLLLSTVPLPIVYFPVLPSVDALTLRLVVLKFTLVEIAILVPLIALAIPLILSPRSLIQASPLLVDHDSQPASLSFHDLAFKQRFQVPLEPEVLTPLAVSVVIKHARLHYVLIRWQSLIIHDK